jgi:hypothetical protein
MYYKAPDNSLHYLDDSKFEYLLPKDSCIITDEEASTLREASLPTPTVDQLLIDFENAVQSYLDSFAKTWRYESILSAATYVTSTITQFKNEAKALIAWRDQVWNSCYTTLEGVQAGTTPIPVSVDAFIATLPAAPSRP